MGLWDGRFASDTNIELTNFTESISFDKRLYSYDILGSIAHVTMLAKCGIIPESTKEKIINELKKIQDKIETNNFEFNPELEDIHMNIEQSLIDSLGDEGARVHTARSRNDQIATDIRLYLKDRIPEITDRIKIFQKCLLIQCEKNQETIMPGFTHLQHAQPILFAHHLLAYVEMFERDAERLSDCRKRIDVMPLGSGAIAGTTLAINRKISAEILNFREISRNSMDAVSDRDFICELLSNLAVFAMHISRLSEDIILWSSEEFKFIELDDAFCTGSSLMPQKKNPDIAELSRGKTARIYSALNSILTLCKGLPLSYNRDLQEDKESLFDALDTVESILKIFPPMIETMKVNKEKMLKAASDPTLMATDLAEELVKNGMPFRTAHQRVGNFVKWCSENNKKLNESSLAEMKKTIPEAKKEFLNLFSPEKSIAKREIFGATGFKQIKKQLEFWKKQLG